jgi:carbon storage regulator
MLVLTRRTGDEIFIDCHGVRIVVKVTEVDRNKVRLGISAPREVTIMRAELLQQERHDLGGEGGGA